MSLYDVTWNDEMFADLREHWLNEKTAQEIANLLNEKYSKTLTRNQVMARIQRLGLHRITNQKSEEELQARADFRRARAERKEKAHSDGIEVENRYVEMQKIKEARRASQEALEKSLVDKSEEYHIPWTKELMGYIWSILIILLVIGLTFIISDSFL